jgi:hypothetical protein
MKDESIGQSDDLSKVTLSNVFKQDAILNNSIAKLVNSVRFPQLAFSSEVLKSIQSTQQAFMPGLLKMAQSVQQAFSPEILNLISSAKFQMNFNVDTVLKNINPQLNISLLKELPNFKNINISELKAMLQNLNDEPEETLRTASNVEIEEIQDIVDSCINTQLNPIVDGINTLINVTRQQKEPFYKKVLLEVLVYIILGLFGMLVLPITQSLQETIYANQKPIAKMVKKEIARTGMDIKLLKGFRFVTVSCLNVRITHKRNSQMVGALTFGQVVKIIRKNKNWSLIEWSNEKNEASIKGWVMTRYISRFK